MAMDNRDAPPTYDLVVVKQHVAAGRVETTNRSCRQCIIDERGGGQAEAIAFAKRMVLTLSSDDFIKPTVLKSGAPADEYGKHDDEGFPWYIKFTFELRAGTRIEQILIM